MRNSKLLLTSLLAAAAMSVSAWADQSYTASEEISSDLTVDGKISVNRGATVTQRAGTVSAERLVLNDSGANTASFYTLTGGVLNITGTEKIGGVTEATTLTNAVLIGHWKNGTSKLTVSEGTLNVTKGFTVISWDSAGTLEVSGGTANLYGVSLNTYRGNTADITLSSGRLNLGEGGLTYGNGTYGRTNKTVTLSGGTLGALTDWSSAVAMNVTGAVKIDTTKQVVGDDGTSAAASDNAGATISLSGNITADAAGTLTVSGAGTLDLSGARVSLSSAITNNATVTVSSDTIFVLSDSLKVSGMENTYSLISNTGGGTINGWNADTLTKSNFTLDGTALSGRQDVNVSTAGTVTITGAVANLVWAGTSGSSTWNTETTNQNWTNNGVTDSFYAQDNVTFGGSVASKTVSVASAVVAGSVAVEDDYTFSFSNNASVTASSVTVSNGKTLTLSGTGSISGISGAGGVTIAADSTISFSGANTFTGTATVNGTAILAGTDLSALGGSGNIAGAGAGAVALTLSGIEGDLDVSRLDGFTGELVFKAGASENKRLGILKTSADKISSLSGIRVENGTQLYLSTWGNTLGSLATDVTIAGNGYATGGGVNNAALRLNDNAELSGHLTLSDDATVHVATTSTISGGISAEEKTLTINGEGTLNISGEKEIAIGTLTINKIGDTNLSSSGTTTIGALNVTAGTVVFSGGDANVSGAISGSGALKKAGAGTLTLSGTSGGFTGGVTVEGENSVLRVSSTGWGNKGPLGDYFDQNKTVLQNGGVLEVTAAQDTDSGNAYRGFSVAAGEGTYRYTGTADSTVAYNSGADAAVKNQFIGIAKGATLIFDVTNKDVTLDVTKRIAKNDVQANKTDALNDTTGALKKTGAGTLILNPYGENNQFSGGVTIEKGVLVAASAGALGSGKTTVASGATLGLVANVTVTGVSGIELAEGAKIVVDMANEALSREVLPEEIVLDLVSSAALSYNGESVTSDNVEALLGSAISLKNWNDGWTQSLSYTDNTLRLTLSIPEPSTFGLLAGLGVLALAGLRRRRRKA